MKYLTGRANPLRVQKYGPQSGVIRNDPKRLGVDTSINSKKFSENDDYFAFWMFGPPDEES